MQPSPASHTPVRAAPPEVRPCQVLDSGGRGRASRDRVLLGPASPCLPAKGRAAGQPGRGPSRLADSIAGFPLIGGCYR